MTLLLFALYTILSGAQQGIITWLFREYVPPARKDWVHAALHYGGVLIYLVLVGWAVHRLGWHSWPLLLIEATAARALLFDPCLSLSQSWFNYREGRPAEPLFKVGTIALLDRALRSLAARLSWPPEQLRLVVWVVSLIDTCSLFRAPNYIRHADRWRSRSSSNRSSPLGISYWAGQYRPGSCLAAQRCRGQPVRGASSLKWVAHG